MTAEIGTGLLAGGAILLLAGPWFTPAVAARTGQAGLVITTAGTVITAYAISWIPIAIGGAFMGGWYAWLVRRAYQDRLDLLRFLEGVPAYVVGPVWCLGLLAGANPYDPELATVVASAEVPAELRGRVLPTAQRQTRWRWAVRNAAALYLLTGGATARPHPFRS